MLHNFALWFSDWFGFWIIDFVLLPHLNCPLVCSAMSSLTANRAPSVSVQFSILLSILQTGGGRMEFLSSKRAKSRSHFIWNVLQPSAYMHRHHVLEACKCLFFTCQVFSSVLISCRFLSFLYYHILAMCVGLSSPIVLWRGMQEQQVDQPPSHQCPPEVPHTVSASASYSHL